jgi:predicted metal-binding membrane protein
MTPPSAGAATRSENRPAGDGRRVAFRWLFAGLTGSAWLTLWLWSVSPYGRLLEHGNWSEVGVLGPICRAIPEGDLLVPALLYALGWVLMIAAMMLPTTLPILEMFRRIVAGRRDANRLVALLVLGYLAAWLGFGLIAHALDGLLHSVVEDFPWLTLHAWVVGAGVLGIAGVFQFSALKYRCLDKCHTPFGFIIQRWRGRSPAREALRLGIDHGLFCIGCCWALMLLMFVVGTGSIGWMLALAAVMAAEKNLAAGKRLRAPLGAALMASAAIVVLVNGRLLGG